MNQFQTLTPDLHLYTHIPCLFSLRWIDFFDSLSLTTFLLLTPMLSSQPLSNNVFTVEVSHSRPGSHLPLNDLTTRTATDRPTRSFMELTRIKSTDQLFYKTIPLCGTPQDNVISGHSGGGRRIRSSRSLIVSLTGSRMIREMGL